MNATGQVRGLSQLLSQLQNDGRMIRRLWLCPRPLINHAALQAAGHIGRQQKMVDANASIMFERLPKVIPKSELAALARMQRPERVRVAETEQRPVPRPRLRLEERVMDPRGRLVAINIFWNNIEVAANHHRQAVLPPGDHLLQSAGPSRPACRQICRCPPGCRLEDKY